MQIIRWTIIWIVIAVGLTGMISYFTVGMNPILWKNYLHTVGGLFFVAALIVGGVFTTDVHYHSRKRFFYREDWSFICILVMITLFGISFML